MRNVKWWLTTRRRTPASRNTPHRSPCSQPSASGRRTFMPSAIGRYQRCWNARIGSFCRSRTVAVVGRAARVAAQHPADVREPEPAAGRVGVAVVVVDVAGGGLRWFAAQCRTLFCSAMRAEQHEHEPHAPVRVEGLVRPEAVIAGRDREAVGVEQHGEPDPAGGAVAVRESVPGHDGHGDRERQGEHQDAGPDQRRAVVFGRWHSSWGFRKPEAQRIVADGPRPAYPEAAR